MATAARGSPISSEKALSDQDAGSVAECGHDLPLCFRSAMLGISPAEAGIGGRCFTLVAEIPPVSGRGFVFHSGQHPMWNAPGRIGQKIQEKGGTVSHARIRLMVPNVQASNGIRIQERFRGQCLCPMQGLFPGIVPRSEDRLLARVQA
jgi:hypothetical protein